MYQSSGGLNPELRLGEDTEFGYRLAQAGAVFVPEPLAGSWHMGPTHMMVKGEALRRYNRPYLADLMPQPRYLRRGANGHWTVPLVNIVIPVGDDEMEVARTCLDRLLACDLTDLRIHLVGNWSAITDERRSVLADPLLERRQIAALFHSDPRVRLVEQDLETAFPSPFLLRMGSHVGGDVVTSRRLISLSDERQLGLVRLLPTGAKGREDAVALWRTSALSRALRVRRPDEPLDRVVAEVLPSGGYRVLDEERENTRLAAALTKTGRLDPKAADATVSVLRNFLSIAAGYNAKADHNGCFVLADPAGIDGFSSAATNRFHARFTNGFQLYTNTAATLGVEALAPFAGVGQPIRPVGDIGPCPRGGDPVPEHDSHGQFIYLIREYYEFTRDLQFLERMWPHVRKAVEYIDALRHERMTAEYQTGEKRAFYGLVPESISHEGYSAKPMHSYWDDFFILTGLKDATEIARILGRTEARETFATIRDAFRRDLYASIDRAMAMHGINYIPGSVELGDFDATSTTTAVNPGGEIGNIPPAALRATFDRYIAPVNRVSAQATGAYYHVNKELLRQRGVIPREQQEVRVDDHSAPVRTLEQLWPLHFQQKYAGIHRGRSLSSSRSQALSSLVTKSFHRSGKGRA